MISKFALLFGLCFSLSAHADETTNLTLKILNNQLAQESFDTSTQLDYLQMGAVVQTPAGLDFTRPYCRVYGVFFRPDPRQTYPVLSVTHSQLDPETYEIDLSMVTHSSESGANFEIACLGAAPLTLDDVKAAINGVYSLTP